MYTYIHYIYTLYIYAHNVNVCIYIYVYIYIFLLLMSDESRPGFRKAQQPMVSLLPVPVTFAVPNLGLGLW
jgi:hypothetical protein